MRIVLNLVLIPFMATTCMSKGQIREVHIEAGDVINIQCQARVGGDVTLRNEANKTVMDCVQTDGKCYRRNYNISLCYSYNETNRVFSFLLQLFDSGYFSCISSEGVSAWNIETKKNPPPMEIRVGEQTNVNCIKEMDDHTGFVIVWDQNVTGCNESNNIVSVTLTSQTELISRVCYISAYENCIMYGGVANAVTSEAGLKRSIQIKGLQESASNNVGVIIAIVITVGIVFIGIAFCVTKYQNLRCGSMTQGHRRCQDRMYNCFRLNQH